MWKLYAVFCGFSLYFTVTSGENALLNQAGVIEFKLGVTFTTTQAYRELQDVNMYANPDFSATSIDRVLSVWTNKFIDVTGVAVLAGVEASDYSVVLNDQRALVASVSSTQLEATLPSVIPTPDVGDYTSIVVRVGEFLALNVGRIWYRIPQFRDSPPRPVIVFDPADFASRIQVDGTNVVVGLTSADYTVRVGEQPCTDVIISMTTLSCRGPTTSPTPSGAFTQSPDNYPQLTIVVPTSGIDSVMYTYHPAYVRYLNHDYTRDTAVPDNTGNNNGGSGTGNGVNPTFVTRTNGSGGSDGNDTLLWVVISICIAGALVLAALLVCCVVCGRRRRDWRQKEDDERYLDSRGDSTPRPYSRAPLYSAYTSRYAGYF